MNEILKNVIMASFATVGIIETVKNFLKTERKWIYALIMIPFSVLCFFIAVKCPSWVIGGILTIGVTQLCYDTIIQTIKNMVKKISEK